MRSHSRFDNPIVDATSLHCFTAMLTSSIISRALLSDNLNSLDTESAVSKDAVVSSESMAVMAR